MRTWIYSTQANVRVVVVTLCTTLFVGATLLPSQQTEAQHYIRTVAAPLVVGHDLARALKFRRLLAEWHAERGATSSITRMAQCDAYVAIMAEGKQILPLIMEQLRLEGDQPDQWFWALQILTDGLDPVKAQDRGNMAKMAEAWLNWWSENPDYAG